MDGVGNYSFAQVYCYGLFLEGCKWDWSEYQTQLWPILAPATPRLINYHTLEVWKIYEIWESDRARSDSALPVPAMICFCIPPGGNWRKATWKFSTSQCPCYGFCRARRRRVWREIMNQTKLWQMDPNGSKWFIENATSSGWKTEGQWLTVGRTQLLGRLHLTYLFQQCFPAVYTWLQHKSDVCANSGNGWLGRAPGMEPIYAGRASEVSMVRLPPLQGWLPNFYHGQFRMLPDHTKWCRYMRHQVSTRKGVLSTTGHSTNFVRALRTWPYQMGRTCKLGLGGLVQNCEKIKRWLHRNHQLTSQVIQYLIFLTLSWWSIWGHAH